MMKQTTYLRYRKTASGFSVRAVCDNLYIFVLISLEAFRIIFLGINYDFFVQIAVSSLPDRLFDDEKYKINNQVWSNCPLSTAFLYFVSAVSDSGTFLHSHANRSNSVLRPLLWKSTSIPMNW